MIEDNDSDYDDATWERNRILFFPVIWYQNASFLLSKQLEDQPSVFRFTELYLTCSVSNQGMFSRTDTNCDSNVS